MCDLGWFSQIQSHFVIYFKLLYAHTINYIQLLRYCTEVLGAPLRLKWLHVNPDFFDFSTIFKGIRRSVTKSTNMIVIYLLTMYVELFHILCYVLWFHGKSYLITPMCLVRELNTFYNTNVHILDLKNG